MKIRCLALIAALVCAVLPRGVMAQASAPAPSSAASAQPAATPGPKQLTPQQSRHGAAAPGDMRPEHATVPQNPPAPPKPQASAARGYAASAIGIGDKVARCEAELDNYVREVCRARLAREGGNR